jgi:hypothetical protein
MFKKYRVDIEYLPGLNVPFLSRNSEGWYDFLGYEMSYEGNYMFRLNFCEGMAHSDPGWNLG